MAAIVFILGFGMAFMLFREIKQLRDDLDRYHKRKKPDIPEPPLFDVKDLK